MKRSILIFIVAIYLAFLPAPSLMQTPPVKSSLAVRQKTFETVWQIVNDTYFDPNFGGVDWKRAHAIYAPKVAKTKTDAELYKILNEMLALFKVSHMQILTPEMLAKLKAPPVTTGLVLREIENRVVVVRLIEESSAVKAGLRPGVAVTEINGKTIKNLADAKQKLSGLPNTSVRLSFLDEKDKPHTVMLKRAPLNQSLKGTLAGLSLYASFESKILTENIGYLRFSNFAGFLKPKIREAVESMNNARGIIIDLRGNSGGEDEVAIDLAGMLFDKETQLMITRTRKGNDYYYKAVPQKEGNIFRGAVVVLVDEQSGSASEQLSAGLQESGRAFIVGKTTEGEDLDADLEELPTGAYLLYAYGEPRTPKGFVIEGRGVIPNLEIALTRKDLLVGRDLQLEAAINYIKTARP